MDSKRNEIKVGIAVLLSLIILIGGVMWGKGYRLRASRYNIEVIFSNVGGLEPGSNVLANGVVKGRVTGVELRGGKVHVRAAIDQNVILMSDYRITIESPTMMAGKVLMVLPGEKTPPAEITQPLTGQDPMGMSEAVGIIEDVTDEFRLALKNVNTLVISLNTIVGDTANQDNIAGLLKESRGAAQTTNEWLTENRERLTATLVRLDEAIASLQSLSTNAENRLTGTLTKADSALSEITVLGAKLRELAAKLESEDGTMGKLLNDDELYKRLNQTLAEVDSLAHQIRTKGMKQKIVLF